MKENEIKQKVLKELMDLMDESVVSKLDRKKKPEATVIIEEEPELEVEAKHSEDCEDDECEGCADDEEESDEVPEEDDEEGFGKSRLMERLREMRKNKEQE